MPLWLSEDDVASLVSPGEAIPVVEECFRRIAVGEVELTVGELLAAHEHQVIRLDRTIEQPVDLLLEGRVVARGQLVAVDEHIAIRITELPTPLKV